MVRGREQLSHPRDMAVPDQVGRAEEQASGLKGCRDQQIPLLRAKKSEREKENVSSRMWIRIGI
jgi:hypothetical protein